jgi:hypothetical protein
VEGVSQCLQSPTVTGGYLNTQQRMEQLNSGGTGLVSARQRGGELAKTPTAIHGLDAITRGGLPKGRPTLVCGGPGKTLHRQPLDFSEAVRDAVRLEQISEGAASAGAGAE